MQRKRELEHLAEAQRHVAKGRALIRQQIAIVRRQRQEEWPEVESIKLLRSLRISVELGRNHIQLIERELGR